MNKKMRRGFVIIALYQGIIKTPLGSMMALSDQRALGVLAFCDDVNLDRCTKSFLLFCGRNVTIQHQETQLFVRLKDELEKYFSGTLRAFDVPLHFYGTPLQKSVGQALCTIGYGQTMSYGEQARKLGHPKSARAMGRLNAMNHLALLVPCHRIISSNGATGGYAWGHERKVYLLKHERLHRKYDEEL